MTSARLTKLTLPMLELTPGFMSSIIGVHLGDVPQLSMKRHLSKLAEFERPCENTKRVLFSTSPALTPSLS